MGKEQLAHLAKLKQLEFASPDDDDVAAIARLPALWFLAITCERLSNVGKERLGMLGDLGRLDLNGPDDTSQSSSVDDDVAAALERLTSLKELSLDDAQITELGMMHLGKLRSLTHLMICDDSTSDEGMMALEKLEYIQSLIIDGEKLRAPRPRTFGRFRSSTSWISRYSTNKRR